MVVAVRCPNAKCRKFMLVEDADQGNVVPCLICKQGVRVPAVQGAAPPYLQQPMRPSPQVPPPPPAATDGDELQPIFDD